MLEHITSCEDRLSNSVILLMFAVLAFIFAVYPARIKAGISGKNTRIAELNKRT